jgi:hypothetical protein
MAMDKKEIKGRDIQGGGTNIGFKGTAQRVLYSLQVDNRPDQTQQDTT